MILLHGNGNTAPQKQSSAWYLVENKLGPAMRARNADDIMEIQVFLNKFLGAQDAFLISAFIGTGVSGKYQSVTDARTSVETLADRELDTFEKADKGKSYGSQTKSGKTVQEAFQNAKQVLKSEYYDWLLTAGEAKKIEADRDFRANVDQELSDMSNKLISGVKNAIVPSPLFGVGAGVVIGVGLFLYLMVRSWERR